MRHSLDARPRLAEVYTWRDATRQSQLNSAAKHVALILAFHMDQAGVTFVGQERIAAETGLHCSTVKRALRDLVAAGWVAVVSEGGSPKGGRRVPTRRIATDPDRVHGDRGQGGPGAWCTTTGCTTRADRVHGAPLTSKELVDDLATPAAFLDEWGGSFTIPVGEGEPSVATDTHLA